MKSITLAYVSGQASNYKAIRRSRDACYHEAGHIVMGIRIGWQVAQVKVTAAGGGETEFNLPNMDIDSPETAENYIRCACAGAIGERLGANSIWIPEPHWLPGEREGASNDMTVILLCACETTAIHYLRENELRCMSWGEINAGVRDLSAEARNKLDAFIAEVHALLESPKGLRALKSIASELMDAGILDGPQVHRIVNNAMNC